MAVIASNNFHTITTHFHIHTQRKPPPLQKLTNLSFSHHNRKPFPCQSSISNSNSNSNSNSEEQRWIREEQRWLREEQRWIREEARWNAERLSLLRQIAELQEEVVKLRKIRSNGVEFDVDFEVSLMKMAKFLEGRSLDRIGDGKEVVSEVESTMSLDNLEEVESVKSLESENVEEKPPLSKTSSKTSSSWSSSLRVGAEGEQVQAMQEALMKLGFYSGEEDMEYSSFSSGTERAVKTWQATIGVREDGIMTVELLERLHSSQEVQSSAPSGSSTNADVPKDVANGAPVNVKEIKKTVKKEAPPDVEVSHNRVFLLGENRWEEPSRLNKGNDKLGSGGKVQSSAPKCIVCRGEGRLMCMECDGSGEPNIEEQFLDWVEDGAKCPYCEGLGYTICDVCRGKSGA